MEEQRSVIRLHPFAYNKIVSGVRKIDIRPYTRHLHSLMVGDRITYVNIENNEYVEKEVKGIALFRNFETLVAYLSPEMIGYESRKETMLHIEKMYSAEDQEKFGVCALFLGD